MVSSNQLQLLNNYNVKVYFVVPNNLTAVFVKTINILREDSSLLSSNNYAQKLGNISKLIKNMGLSLRLFCGKDVPNEQRQFHFLHVKDNILPQLVKFQYLNFPTKIFNVGKYRVKIDLITEALKELIVIQTVQKSFRKPQAFEQLPLSMVADIDLLRIIPSSKQARIPPFNTKQTLTFKYPILRPIFQSKKKDGYYFMIRKSHNHTSQLSNPYIHNPNEKNGNGMGCNVTFYKGENWIGLQEDKQRYFQKIVNQYLKEVNQQRIWIQDHQQSGMQKSLFDGDSLMF